MLNDPTTLYKWRQLMHDGWFFRTHPRKWKSETMLHLLTYTSLMLHIDAAYTPDERWNDATNGITGNGYMCLILSPPSDVVYRHPEQCKMLRNLFGATLALRGFHSVGQLADIDYGIRGRDPDKIIELRQHWLEFIIAKVTS
jgi:hypothetical protein